MTGDLGVYRTLLRATLAGHTSYRASFAMDLAGSGLVIALDFLEIYAIFTQVPTVAGFTFADVFLIFALASTSFSLGDMLLGQTDRVTDHVRAGTLDVLLLRPLSTLGQLAAADLQLRRLGRLAVASVALVVALGHVEVDWTPARVAMLVLAPVAGTVLYAALFVAAGAVSFWLVDGREVGNALTYGSGYLSQWPLGVLSPVLGRFFTFVVPAAFGAYLPALAILGREDPTGLPSWLPWLTPVAALAAAAGSGLLWRLGIRHYTGAGG